MTNTVFIVKLLSVKKLINYTLIDNIKNYKTHHGNLRYRNKTNYLGKIKQTNSEKNCIKSTSF